MLLGREFMCADQANAESVTKPAIIGNQSAERSDFYFAVFRITDGRR